MPHLNLSQLTQLSDFSAEKCKKKNDRERNWGTSAHAYSEVTAPKADYNSCHGMSTAWVVAKSVFTLLLP